MPRTGTPANHANQREGVRDHRNPRYETHDSLDPVIRAFFVYAVVFRG
jgi:hypothetical protein